MAIPPRITNFFSALTLFDDQDKTEPEPEPALKLRASSSSPSKKKRQRKAREKSTSVQNLSRLAAGNSLDSSKEPIAASTSLKSESSNVDERLKEASAVEVQNNDCSSTNGQKENGTPSNVTNELSAAPLADVRQNESNAARAIVADGKESVAHLKWPLVWIDLEMTGLDLERDRILEIACIITDGKLQKMVEGPDLIINQPEELLRSMGEWCQTHHTANGLVEGVRHSKVTEQQAEQEVLEFVRQHTGPVQPLLAGNSIYVDFMFLRKYMPDLAALFPHVVVDVSSIKALCFRWFPKDADRAPGKKKKHRAAEDIKESIAELRYMQKTIFKQSKK